MHSHGVAEEEAHRVRFSSPSTAWLVPQVLHRDDVAGGAGEVAEKGVHPADGDHAVGQDSVLPVAMGDTAHRDVVGADAGDVAGADDGDVAGADDGAGCSGMESRTRDMLSQRHVAEDTIACTSARDIQWAM